jgi:hypothetical protein
MSITKDQKRIYNLHLSTYKKRQNKPYTLRENFENFSTEHPEDYVNLMKIERFFNNHKYINQRCYFEAPYQIYKDRTFFDLQFYTTMAAIKMYNLYMQQLNEKLPDSQSQLEYVKESLLFIRDFCIENKITLLEYLKFRKALTLSWATHLAEYKITFYVLLGLEEFGVRVYDLLFNMPEDERELLLGDIVEKYAIYKDNFKKSKIAKQFIIAGLKKIDIFIKENLISISQCGNI